MTAARRTDGSLITACPYVLCRSPLVFYLRRPCFKKHLRHISGRCRTRFGPLRHKKHKSSRRLPSVMPFAHRLFLPALPFAFSRGVLIWTCVHNLCDFEAVCGDRSLFYCKYLVGVAYPAGHSSVFYAASASCPAALISGKRRHRYGRALSLYTAFCRPPLDYIFYICLSLSRSAIFYTAAYPIMLHCQHCFLILTGGALCFQSFTAPECSDWTPLPSRSNAT